MENSNFIKCCLLFGKPCQQHVKKNYPGTVIRTRKIFTAEKTADHHPLFFFIKRYFASRQNANIKPHFFTIFLSVLPF